jgi:hypothetical protein
MKFAASAAAASRGCASRAANSRGASHSRMASQAVSIVSGL